MKPTIFKRRMSIAPMRVTSPNAAGFTLIELLIVVGMVGIFMAAVFSLYQTHQRSAYTQEDTAEVQQNLRVAMGTMMNDIRMAGFLVPGGTNSFNFTDNTGLVGTDTDGLGNPIGTDILSLFSGAPSTVAARNTTPTQDKNMILGESVDLSVNSIESFMVGDATMIVVPVTGAMAMPMTFTVTAAISTGTCGVVAAPCMTLKADAAGDGTIRQGDMIVKSTGPFPNTIVYSMVTGVVNCPAGQNCLQRSADDGTGNQIIATNITGLQFRYVLQNGLEVDAPADLTQVRGVRVTLTGQRANTIAFTGGFAQPRTLVSVASLRN